MGRGQDFARGVPGAGIDAHGSHECRADGDSRDPEQVVALGICSLIGTVAEKTFAPRHDKGDPHSSDTWFFGLLGSIAGKVTKDRIPHDGRREVWLRLG